jgi:uncharacterized protein
VKRILGLAVFCAAFLAVFAVALPASAHVTVAAPGAAPGGYTVLTFRVPTESDSASTTKLAVQLPTETPFASVAVQPHPGWSFTTRTTTLAKPITTDDGDQISKAVSEIDWTADSAATAIKPGEFDQFNVSVGPLPDADSVSFGAVQTYSDGTIVRWNQVAAPGSDTEPEHPKPTLSLTADAPEPEKADTTAATVLSIVALVLAAAALGLALVGNARRKARGG